MSSSKSKNETTPIGGTPQPVSNNSVSPSEPEVAAPTTPQPASPDPSSPSSATNPEPITVAPTTPPVPTYPPDTDTDPDSDIDLFTAIRRYNRKRPRGPPPFRSTYSPPPLRQPPSPNTRPLILPNFLARTREPTPPGQPGDSLAHPLTLDSSDEDEDETSDRRKKQRVTASPSSHALSREEGEEEEVIHTPLQAAGSATTPPTTKRSPSPLPTIETPEPSTPPSSSSSSPEYRPPDVENIWTVYRSLRFRPSGGRYADVVAKRREVAVRCGEYRALDEAKEEVMERVMREESGVVEKRMDSVVGNDGETMAEGVVRFEGGQMMFVWVEREMREV